MATETELPPKVLADIERILEIKMKAMSDPLPGMRSLDGGPGREVNEIMDRIGKSMDDLNLGAPLANETDIKVRVVLWALDRKAHPRKYSDFAKLYVNLPRSDEGWLAYLHAARGDSPLHTEPIDITLRPHVIAALPIKGELLVEQNRLMFEYSFFVPPTGIGFHDRLSRGRLVEALVALGHFPRSMAVMEMDATMAVRAAVPDNKALQNLEAAHFFVAANSERAFDALAEIWRVAAARPVVTWAFEFGLNDWPERSYASRKELFEAWQQLAGEDHETAEGQAFAEWLRSVPPPEPPPRPGKFNPDDPFSSGD